MNKTILVISITMMGWATLIAYAASTPQTRQQHGEFTGDLKLVFYVKDVQPAVKFYTDVLGFTFHHFYDHVSGDSVHQWVREEQPIYAEMSYAGRRFGIHKPTSEADKRSVGGAKVYFRVKDLPTHHQRTSARNAKPSKIKKRSWMDMFNVVDPDGNRIYFAFTDDNVHGNPWFGK